MIVLRQVSKYVYDVFSGTGWPQEGSFPFASNAQWSRVRQNTWGVQRLAGANVSKNDLLILQDVIAAYPRGNVNAVEA